MAQLSTFKPNSIEVTAAQTGANNGLSFLASVNTLPNWNRFVLFGVIEDGTGPIENAGVRIYQLAASGDPLTENDLIATVFTDAVGEYGISLATLTAPAVYAVEAYSPGN